MRDYGKVYTAFWLDPTMRAMSEDGRALALYLMTCPHGNMLGCFRLTNAYAADDLQWKPERVSKGFSELFEYRFAYRCDTSFWVVIRQYLKWNQFENPNVAKAAVKMFDTLPCSNQIKRMLSEAIRDFSTYFPMEKLNEFEESSEPFDNPFKLSAETRTRTIAITRATTGTTTTTKAGTPFVELKPDRAEVETIFAYWQKTMKAPRAVLDSKRKALILAALKNYEPRQICQAILGCSRSAHHMGENDRNTKYNGLGLILRNAEYIEKFIELASKVQTGPETIEQRNARIIQELTGGTNGGEDDPDTIEMEE